MSSPPDISNVSLAINLRIQGQVDKYPAKSHARRVAKQLDVSSGIIILYATKAANWPNSDMPAPFRQDRYFYYLTGCNEADTIVTYSIKRDVLTLWLPQIDKARVVWYGRGSTVDEALEKYDIDEAKYIDKPGDVDELFRKTLLARETLPTTIYTLSPNNPLKHAIDTCRPIKDDHEIALIRRANHITAAAHEHVMRHLHAFTTEADVEAAYTQTCIARRAKTQAYDPIAGSGPNAAELHYSANTAAFGPAETLVLDAGCEVALYASDVTRTMPLNPRSPGHWPSPETRRVHDLVARVQERCIAALRPGQSFLEIFWFSHQLVIEGLLELGVLQGDQVGTIFVQGTARAFFPHGLGHHVGLDVHDVSPVPHPPAAEAVVEHRQRLGDAFRKWRPEWAHLLDAEPEAIETLVSLSAALPVPHSASHVPRASSLHASADAVLEPNMVVTVEPGIYFNEFLLANFYLNDPAHLRFINTDVLEQYMHVGGVRIEDDILVTGTGYENLTVAKKGDAMLELIREGAVGKRA
jgi:Xaa-Pro dipeptidase